jgi:putative membrane protein
MKLISKAVLAMCCLLLASPTSVSAREGQAGPDDAQIAQVVLTANTVDVSAGKVARKRTRNAEVKKFAEMMVTDHTAVNKQAADLVKKLRVTPAASDASRSLEQGGKDNLAKLKALKGLAFDKEYVGHEVAYHQAVLDTIDQTLIPHARNEELKALIVRIRPAVDAHLQHAKKLQGDLSAGGPS